MGLGRRTLEKIHEFYKWLFVRSPRGLLFFTVGAWALAAGAQGVDHRRVQAPPSNAHGAVTIEVGGQRLRLSANTDPSHIEALAAFVNERVEVVSRTARGGGTPTLLALVALDLADEVQTLRTRVQSAEREASERVAAAETRAREIEQTARAVVAETLSEIDRVLGEDLAEG